jgi:hypothetical protein
MNEEAADIRKEGRSEEAEKRAETRRELAEQRIAAYKKKLDFDWEGKNILRSQDLYLSGQHPDLLKEAAEAEAEAKRIREGDDPAVLRADQQDLSEAARIRAGLDAGTAEKRRDLGMAEEIADAEAEAAGKKQAAIEEAQAASDKKRREEGNPPLGAESSTTLKITGPAANRLFEDNLGAVLGAPVADIRKRVSKGESILTAVKDGEINLSDELSKNPESRELVIQELAVQLMPDAKNTLADAAAARGITSSSQVKELADQVRERAETMVDLSLQNTANITKWRQQKATGKSPKPDTPEAVLAGLEQQLADMMGEDKKRSASFKQVWSVFRRSYATQLGLSDK